MTIIIFVVSFAVGGGFLYLAWLNFAKEKYPTSTMFGVIAALFLFCGFPWFQALAKTWIVSNVNSKLASLGTRLDDVQNTTLEMQSQLGRHQTQIDTNQNELKSAQEKLRDSQKNLDVQQLINSNQQQRIVTMQADLASSQTNLEAQAAQLRDIKYWVENIYENVVTETIPLSDTNRVTKVKLQDQEGWMYFINLKQVPVKNSLQVQMVGAGFLGQNVILQKPFAVRNIMAQGLGEGYASRNISLFVQFVRDTRQTNLVQRVDVKGDSVFFDSEFIDWRIGK